jgi:hypothetical protein
MVIVLVMKERGRIVNGQVLRLCRERLLGETIEGKPSIVKAAKLIGVTPQLWSLWELGGRGISEDNLSLLVDLFRLPGPQVLLASTAQDAETEAERQRTRRNEVQAERTRRKNVA